MKKWLEAKDKPFFYLAGYAGTGKTTLAQYLAEGIEGDVLFAAFTGKAASVMRKMGCPGARTLHSIMYIAADDLRKIKLKELRRQLVEAKSKEESEEAQKAIQKLKQEIKGPIFTLNPESVLKSAKLLVLDECSMVNNQLAQDALSFGTPILVLGDPAQLPPVYGAGYFTKHNPDHLLTEIHRQAADNPIIRWATQVRNGNSLSYGDEGRVKKVHKGEVDFDNLTGDVQVITGKNAVRRNLNLRIRAAQGRQGELPVEGDRLVCLKNEAELGLLNGVVCSAADDAMRVDDECISMSVTYEGMYMEDLPVASVIFDRYVDPKLDEEFIDRYLQQFDYGYVLTVHKAQGSQWDDVIVADDKFAYNNPMIRRRWLYTAITRASERLTIVE